MAIFTAFWGKKFSWLQIFCNFGNFRQLFYNFWQNFGNFCEKLGGKCQISVIFRLHARMFLWRSFFYYVCTHRFLVVLLQDDLLMNGWHEWDSQNILGPRKGHDKVWSLKAINKMAIWELLLLFLGLLWLFNKTDSVMVWEMSLTCQKLLSPFKTIWPWSSFLSGL